MRETRTSGSTRGEWVALPCCPLSYSTISGFAFDFVLVCRFAPRFALMLE